MLQAAHAEPRFVQRYTDEAAPGERRAFDGQAGGEAVPGKFFVMHKTPPLAQLAAARRQDALGALRGEREGLFKLLRQAGAVPARAVERSFEKLLNASVVSGLSDRQADALRRRGVRLTPVVRVRAALADSVPLIGADQVQAAAAPGGGLLDGTGIRVGVIDTGIDFTHEAFGSCSAMQFAAHECARVPGGRNFIDPDVLPLDNHYHGTHVAAIIGASGTLRGTAPGVQLYALKVLDSNGLGSSDNIVAAMEYAVDPDGDGDFSDRLDVINLSLGGPGDPDDAMSQAADRAAALGVVVVAAAGNSGPTEGSIGSPGTARGAVTVAASYARAMGDYGSDTDTQPDQVAYFSSRGPVAWRGGTLHKPDITAPGVSICAAKASAAAGVFTSCGDGYIRLSGTSMAAPHIAGAAALIRQAHPEWSVLEVKNQLMQTAKDLAGADGVSYPLMVQGFGRVRAVDAVLGGQAPVAQIEASGPAHGVLQLRGSAYGSGFSGYSVEWREVGSEAWLPLAQGSAPVNGGVLAAIELRGASSGLYEARLTVNAGGRQAHARQYITVSNVWISNPAPLGDADPAQAETIYGVSEPLEVRGGSDLSSFVRYTLKLCSLDLSKCTSEVVTLAGGGLQQVKQGVLGYIDLRGRRFQNGLFRVRLEVYTASGRVEETTSLINIDPDLLPGYPHPFEIVGDGFFYKSPLQQPVLADLNADGAEEIIYSYDTQLNVLSGDWLPLAGFPLTLPGSSNSTPPLVADLDGDGSSEIAAVDNGSGKVQIFDADGGPLAALPYLDRSLAPLHFLDLDGDGRGEIITAQLSAYTLDGAEADGWRKASAQSPGRRAAAWARGAAIGDLDLDGEAELAAVAEEPAGVHVFASSGAVRWSQAIPDSWLSEPTLVDLDRDGLLEIVVVGGEVVRSSRAAIMNCVRAGGSNGMNGLRRSPGVTVGVLSRSPTSRVNSGSSASRWVT